MGIFWGFHLIWINTKWIFRYEWTPVLLRCGCSRYKFKWKMKSVYRKRFSLSNVFVKKKWISGIVTLVLTFPDSCLAKRRMQGFFYACPLVCQKGCLWKCGGPQKKITEWDRSHRNNWSVAEVPSLQEIPFSVIYFVTFQRLWRLRRRPKVGVLRSFLCALQIAHEFDVRKRFNISSLGAHSQGGFATNTFVIESLEFCLKQYGDCCGINVNICCMHEPVN